MMLGIDLLSGPLAATCLVGTITLLLVFWYSSRNHDYWKKRGVAYVKPLPFFGSLLDVLLWPLHEIEQERHKKYGPVYGLFEGNNPVLSIGDPELLRDILVKDFSSFINRRDARTGNKLGDSFLVSMRGDDWKRVRTIITPTFTTGKIKKMLGIFKECSRTLMQNYRTVAETKKSVDVKRVYGAFTMDVIASSAFSTKIDSHNDADNEFVKTARSAFSAGVSWKRLIFILIPGLVRMLQKLGLQIFATGTVDFFKRVTLQIVEERKKTGQVRNDFLQLLMDTAKEVSDEEKWDLVENDKGDIASNYGQEAAGHSMFKNVTSKTLSIDELIAQCIIFFLAGYETTASTLSFATYLLALNPDVQDKLRAEVDEALKQANGEITYESIQKMKYLDNVISETLRIFPPAIRLERSADVDYKLGDTGITIPKGMIVSVPVYAIHRNPKLYPDPERFDPDRFSAEERSKRHQYAYLPFGAGPRNCIGMRFALIEIKVCLAYVVTNFIIKRSPETKVPLEFPISQIGLLQAKDVTVQMEIRKDHICSVDFPIFKSWDEL